MNKLLQLLEIETREIQEAFAKASIEGRGTPQEIADRREGFIKNLLEKYFPFPNRVAKGNIIDSYGNESPSFDCILLNSIHPHTINKESEKHSVILADGVDFVMDVKGDLKQDELFRALAQIQKLKKVKRVSEFKNFTKPKDEIKPTLQTLPVIIYAESSYKNHKDLVDKIDEFYTYNKIDLLEQFDCIIINGEYALINLYPYSYSDPRTKERGIAAFEFKNSLAFLLLYIVGLPTATPDLIEPIISRYIKWNDDPYTFYKIVD